MSSRVGPCRWIHIAAESLTVAGVFEDTYHRVAPQKPAVGQSLRRCDLSIQELIDHGQERRNAGMSAEVS